MEGVRSVRRVNRYSPFKARHTLDALVVIEVLKASHLSR